MLFGSTLSASLAVGALLFAASPANAVNFTFTIFQEPGQTQTRASGINNEGQIAGTSYEPGSYHGFVDNNGAFSSVNAPGANHTDTIGINNSGQVAGTFYDANGPHGYIETNGAFTTLNAPEAAPYVPGSDYGTMAAGINDSGQVVGSYVNSVNGNTVAHAYLYSNGAFTTLTPPGFTTGAFGGAINNSGQVVGSLNSTAIGGSIPFLYSNGAYTFIQPPAGTYFRPTGINDSGQIVGYNESNGSFSLDNNGVFTTVNVPGFSLTGPLGINDSGQIVGSFTNNNSDDYSFVATPISHTPEPSAVSLVGAVLLAGLLQMRSNPSSINSK